MPLQKPSSIERKLGFRKEEIPEELLSRVTGGAEGELASSADPTFVIDGGPPPTPPPPKIIPKPNPVGQIGIIVKW